LPLIRYRTRDRTMLHAEKCECGRTMVRMEKVRGRTDDMLVVRGVNVFPSQVEHVLLSFDEVEPQYMIYVDREKDKLDRLEVHVEASDKLFAQGGEQIQEVEKKIAKAMQEVLVVGAKIKVVEPKSIERSMGKARRIIDKREVGF
jgi:phenylacetate-CoA ligase